ncbi:baseplate J-like family protein [Candidatus Vondammii sp. HM_W22]|uniref:baseplate J-like family protein n=1 Tax=Candidatus Vondammii sp. HM_W22 TaxID=2687299 RepID=UPI001F13F6F0|nr:baseplate J-like family protein [Candidatus Vondammii sp. HM_W22]
MTLLASTALQSLPDPTIIEDLDFEVLLNEVKADFIRFAPELASSLVLESEPANKIAQAITYRILHERKLANDQALSLMLAKAEKSQLDHLGSLPFINTPRKTITPVDNEAVPPVPAVLEIDAEYRLRLHIALEGFSTAGPVDAYIYHGLAAHEDIKDIAVDAPTFTRWAIPSELTNSLPNNGIVLIPDYDAGIG